ncbi:MAG: imidazole glycerol phosphate synthase subunit HisF [Phycisphaerales bacterium]
MNEASVVHVVTTGTANVASVVAALERAGAHAIATTDPDVVRSALALVLPGVGSLGAAMAVLGAAGLVEPLRDRLAAGRATLCVCLGMQMLLQGSEESPGVRGLGVLSGVARRFEENAVRVPQIGWNEVDPDPACGLLQSGAAYFANSFRLTSLSEQDALAGWRAAHTEYGGRFVAAVERGSVLACQFHPELSGAWGAALLKRWVQQARDLGPAAASPPAWSPVRPERLQGAGVMRRVVPCLDVRDGRVVKGVRFAGLRDAGCPAERAAAYQAQGADELVVLDVSATPEGRGAALETVRRVRQAISIPLTVGGGVRTIDDATALLEAGADKVSVNSAAVRDPRLLAALAGRFGSQCVVLAIDAARRSGGWQVVVRSGTERVDLDAVEWARSGTDAGAGEVLLTSFDRDGTRSGYDLALIAAVARAVRVPVIASGGAAGPEHLANALHAGAEAVLAASIFHDGEWTVASVKRALAQRGVRVREEATPDTRLQPPQFRPHTPGFTGERPTC